MHTVSETKKTYGRELPGGPVVQTDGFSATSHAVRPHTHKEDGRNVLCFVRTQNSQFSKPCFFSNFLELLLLQKFRIRYTII